MPPAGPMTPTHDIEQRPNTTEARPNLIRTGRSITSSNCPQPFAAQVGKSRNAASAPAETAESRRLRGEQAVWCRLDAASMWDRHRSVTGAHQLFRVTLTKVSAARKYSFSRAAQKSDMPPQHPGEVDHSWCSHVGGCAGHGADVRIVCDGGAGARRWRARAQLAASSAASCASSRAAGASRTRSGSARDMSIQR